MHRHVRQPGNHGLREPGGMFLAARAVSAGRGNRKPSWPGRPSRHIRNRRTAGGRRRPGSRCGSRSRKARGSGRRRESGRRWPIRKRLPVRPRDLVLAARRVRACRGSRRRPRGPSGDVSSSCTSRAMRRSTQARCSASVKQASEPLGKRSGRRVELVPVQPDEKGRRPDRPRPGRSPPPPGPGRR